MALSGSFSASQRGGKETVRCDWSGTQNVSNNTTTITAKLYFINQYAINIGSRTHTLTIDGTSFNISTSTINTTGEHYLGSVTKSVSHNSNGTKSISMSFNFSLKATLSGTYYENISQSTTASLNTIPRASQPTLSVSSQNFGSNVTIYTHRASTSFTHHLYYSFNSGSEIAANTSGFGDNCTWTIPKDLMKQIPNAPSGTITFKLYTFNGSTNIGNNTVKMTATVPSSVVPSISKITCSDPTGYSNTYGGYVQNKSKVKVTVSASGTYSSTIKSYKISANRKTYTSNGCTTDVLSTSGTNTISATVTDSRSRTSNNTSTTINVIPYSNPKVTVFACDRCDIDGNIQDNGSYMKIVVNASVSEVNNLNNKEFILQYKLSSQSDYQNIETYSDSYTYSTEKIVEIGQDDTVEVDLIVSDSFTRIPFTKNIGSAYTLLDFKSNGRGIALGKVSSEDGFDVNMETRFRKDLRSDGDVIANLGSDNQISLTELNNNLSNILSRFGIGTGTFPSATNSNVSCTIPSGFAQNNCCQIGFIAQNANGTWYNITDNIALSVYPGRVIYTANSAYNGKPFKVIYYKYN